MTTDQAATTARPLDAFDITAESTIGYDAPRGQLYRAPEGVVLNYGLARFTLTPEQARDLADQLVVAAIEAENAGERDDHDRGVDRFRGQFG